MNDLLEFLTRMLDHIVGNIQDTHTHMYVLTSAMCSWSPGSCRVDMSRRASWQPSRSWKLLR